MLPLISSVLGEWKEKDLLSKNHSSTYYLCPKKLDPKEVASVSESKSKMKAICCIAKLLTQDLLAKKTFRKVSHTYTSSLMWVGNFLSQKRATFEVQLRKQ